MVTPSSTTTRRFRVVPLDAAAAEGMPAYGPTFRVVAKSEAATPALVYGGAWTTAVNTSCYGGKARYTRSATASVRFTFTGIEVAWIATRGPTRGAAKVYVDGRYIATVNLAGTAFYRRVAFRHVFATGGTHTLTIRPTGSGRIDVDGFLVLR
jgi:hypothetical protein